MAITVTASSSTSFTGILCRVRVLTGATLATSPATATFGGTGAQEASITTTQTGSMVYGALKTSSTTTLTAASGTTLLDNIVDSPNGEILGSCETTSVTGTPGATTVGASAPSVGGQTALLEVLPNGTITLDPSTPASASTLVGTSITTAAFSPPGGSILVAIVTADANATTVITVSGGGLTWTERVKSLAAGGQTGYSGIWTAVVPAPSFPHARPGGSWLRKFRHRQVAFGPTVAPPPPPLAPAPPPGGNFVPGKAVPGQAIPGRPFIQLSSPPLNQQAMPGQTWTRRFKHRQVLLGTPPPVQAPVSGPPVYPLGHPVQARQLPAQGGKAAQRKGLFAQSGPAVRPLKGPVKGQPQAVPFLTGRAAGRKGTFAQAGPPVRALSKPVQAAKLPLRPGTATSRSGVLSVSGPPVRQWDGPVRGQPQFPFLTGRTSSRAGRYGQAGPLVRQWHGPVQGQPQVPLLKGRVTSRAGTFAQSGPPVRPMTGPVQSRQLPQHGGNTASRAGTFTAPPPVIGAPSVPANPGQTWRRQFQHKQIAFPPPPPPPAATFYPLGRPVQARQLPLQGGRVANRDGVYGQAGPPVRQWNGPVRAQPQFVPFIPGRTASRDGVLSVLGPPVRRWTGPVRATQPLPPAGRASSRYGTLFVPTPGIAVPGTPARPGQTWLRRFRHTQAGFARPPIPAVDITVTIGPTQPHNTVGNVQSRALVSVAGNIQGDGKAAGATQGDGKAAFATASRSQVSTAGNVQGDGKTAGATQGDGKTVGATTVDRKGP